MWYIQFQGKKYFPSDTVGKRHFNKLSDFIYSLLMVTASFNALFPSLIESNRKNTSLLHLFPSHPTAKKEARKVDLIFLWMLSFLRKLDNLPSYSLKKLISIALSYSHINCCMTCELHAKSMFLLYSIQTIQTSLGAFSKLEGTQTEFSSVPKQK